LPSCTGWHGWFAPAKTPDAIVTRIYTGLRDVLKVPRVREYFVVPGYEPIADPPAQFQKSFQAELKSWGDIVRLAKIPPE
jgi:tripartite-type tricarboxylate transporter receptor subunit TctC